ncbi:hypothetical protein SAMN02745121_07355 [Nannocystis exedens]|uniref:WGR domain-containing protein n=1 Tax=Nannocystis exedens TaxID=54 RepID=A0A1I2GKN6_9BACT|nr:hypothetical protein [Nannocystis exedens]PCC73606.1 hypothetical protein NAEX_06694 [Nannocystis exedens]SFF17793.1 hypothetical protein SAMN02745121_07355 [Nannocystis exedens]
MATLYILAHKLGGTCRLTLAGNRLETDEGGPRHVQTFPSEKEAKEHLERVISIHKRGGYVLAESQDLGEVPLPDDDPLAGCVAWDAERRKMTVTFKGHEVPRGLCARLVERILERAPATIQMICDLASPGAAFTAALAGKALPSVTSLIFDTHFQTLTRQRENAIGDLAHVLAALPNIERVFASGALALSPTRHDKLRELYLLGDPLKPALVKALGASTFPALETLALDLCSDDGPGPDRATVAALRSLTAPALRTVHVSDIEDVRSFLAALAAKPLPASWSSLCLRGTLDDEDELLASLERLAPALQRLEELGLSMSHSLSQDAEPRAQKLVRAVVDSGKMPELCLPEVYLDW